MEIYIPLSNTIRTLQMEAEEIPAVFARYEIVRMVNSALATWCDMVLCDGNDIGWIEHHLENNDLDQDELLLFLKSISNIPANYDLYNLVRGHAKSHLTCRVNSANLIYMVAR